jgi:hypothetical protein
VTVDHFALGGEMRNPLAAKLAGSSVIKRRDAIRTYWHAAYGGLTNPTLALESTVWDDACSASRCGGAAHHRAMAIGPFLTVHFQL